MAIIKTIHIILEASSVLQGASDGIWQASRANMLDAANSLNGQGRIITAPDGMGKISIEFDATRKWAVITTILDQLAPVAKSEDYEIVAYQVIVNDVTKNMLSRSEVRHDGHSWAMQNSHSVVLA